MSGIKTPIRILAMAALGLAAGWSFSPMPAAAGDEAQDADSFFEGFDSFDPGRWYVSNGWANGPQQNCIWSDKNFRVSNGALELILRKQSAGDPPPEKASEGRDYSCAELQTRQTYGYGTYEVRASAAAAPGLVSAFFSFIGPDAESPARHDEIDFEFLGKSSQAVQLNYFAEGQGGHELLAPLGFDASQTMASYAFEWRADSIRWYIDGKLVHEARAETGKPFPKTPSKIFVSLWSSDNSEDWLGKFADPGKPLVARFDWLAFTKAGESCRFPQSILCQPGKVGEAERRTLR